MFSLGMFVLFGILLLTFSLYHFVLTPPSNFPKNIPTIPFYVSLIPLFKDVDQEETFRQYLEAPLTKYGAIKIFFGARWNVLVQRPSLIAEVFKYEDTFAKSGNHKKIPYSVLAEYTGDNIISAHGKNWRLYQKIIKPGLQSDFDPSPIVKTVRRLLKLIFEEQAQSLSKGVLVPALFQRHALANLSEALLGTDFSTLDRSDAPLHALQTAVKREIFKPIYLNFPFLDRLRLPSRQRARALVAQFGAVLCSTVANSHLDCKHDGSQKPENLGCRLLMAYSQGALTSMQLRHNLTSVFLAGHENPQLLLTSAVFLLAEHPGVQDQLRSELRLAGLHDAEPDKLASLPLLNAVIYEVLRLYPPISQLINRRTTHSVALGGSIMLPEGTYVGYNAYATGRDRGIWGADAESFRPQRWGASIEEVRTNYRQVSRDGGFITFHGGRRACAGQRWAMFGARITLFELVRKTWWELDPGWERKMTSASTRCIVQEAFFWFFLLTLFLLFQAGPLYPRLLRARFHELVEVERF